MSVPRQRRRLFAAAVLAGSGLAAGVITLTGPAMAAPSAGVDVASGLGEVGSVTVTAQVPRFPSEPQPTSEPTPSSEPTEPEPTPTETSTCDPYLGCPTVEPTPPQPTLPTEPPKPTSTSTRKPSEPPTDPRGPNGAPTHSARPEGPVEEYCAPNDLTCDDDATDRSGYGRVTPTDSAGELAETGIENLTFLGLLGAALIGVGGFMAFRHYRGRHRA